MPIDDPSTWVQGATALKSMLDGFRTAIRLIRDVRDLGGSNDPAKNKAIEDALDKAEVGAKIAEAEIAKALGYELCRCQFPPTPMITVGYKEPRQGSTDMQVYECQKCGFNTAAPFRYTRLAPPRETCR